MSAVESCIQHTKRWKLTFDLKVLKPVTNSEIDTSVRNLYLGINWQGLVIMPYDVQDRLTGDKYVLRSIIKL